MLLSTEKKGIILFIIYTGKAMPLYAEVYKKTGILLEGLKETILKV